MLLLVMHTGLADREAQTYSESKGVGFCCRVSSQAGIRRMPKALPQPDL
jgi:hypothetical protein